MEKSKENKFSWKGFLVALWVLLLFIFVLVIPWVVGWHRILTAWKPLL
jgi:hypothetical protein